MAADESKSCTIAIRNQHQDYFKDARRLKQFQQSSLLDQVSVNYDEDGSTLIEILLVGESTKVDLASKKLSLLNQSEQRRLQYSKTAASHIIGKSGTFLLTLKNIAEIFDFYSIPSSADDREAVFDAIGTKKGLDRLIQKIDINLIKA